MVTLKKISLFTALILATPRVSFAYPQPTVVVQAIAEHARNLKDSLSTRLQKIRKGSEAYVPRLRPVPTMLAGAGLVGIMALIIVARSLGDKSRKHKPSVSEENGMSDTIGRSTYKETHSSPLSTLTNNNPPKIEGTDTPVGLDTMKIIKSDETASSPDGKFPIGTERINIEDLEASLGDLALRNNPKTRGRKPRSPLNGIFTKQDSPESITPEVLSWLTMVKGTRRHSI